MDRQEPKAVEGFSNGSMVASKLLYVLNTGKYVACG
jgi:hypothetical protein